MALVRSSSVVAASVGRGLSVSGRVTCVGCVVRQRHLKSLSIFARVAEWLFSIFYILLFIMVLLTQLTQAFVCKGFLRVTNRVSMPGTLELTHQTLSEPNQAPFVSGLLRLPPILNHDPANLRWNPHPFGSCLGRQKAAFL